MKLPISWLRDWIEFDGDAGAVAGVLTRRGFYVEGIEHHGHDYPGVVVARVIEVRKHPNADKLSLCRVDGGAGELKVVCGAPNVRDGMIVPLATVGASLPGGLVIRKSKIRGEESEGMLCSAKELKLAEDHTGILDLTTYFGRADGLAPGRPLDELMPPADQVLEVEVPFNRPDGLGVLGLAREVCAGLGGRWTAAAGARLAARHAPSGGFDLALEDETGCPFYLAQAVEGVKVGPSPEWMVRRLEAAGQRSISNLVDITNLVLLELGQPLHAFDLDRLAGPAIRVRRARAGEKLTTLDGRERELTPEILVIADRDRAVALAGIMGGADSEVSAGTTRVLLECAWFEPRLIRRGSKSLGLATEASKRFERSVDPEIGPVATARFLELLRAVCPDARPAAGALTDVRRLAPASLTLRDARVRRVAGLDLPAGRAAEHLAGLGFEVAPAAEGTLRVTVPSWRADIALEDDLVEEVARSEGYDAIPEARLETQGVHARRSERERRVTRAREAMRARGLTEAWTTSLVSAAEAAAAAGLLGDDPAAVVPLANPMSREGEVLRPNLAPGLLRALAHNLRNGVAGVRLYEVGQGFRGRGQGLPEERPMVAAVATGPRFAHAHDAAQGTLDFADAKGLWEGFLAEMGVDSPRWRAYSGPGWKPGAAAEVAGATSRIGWAGALSRTLLQSWGIETPPGQDVHLFVALLDPLAEAASVRSRVLLPGRFPAVRRDLAFFVPVAASHEQVVGAMRGAGGEWLSDIELFDIYTGPGTPEGMKSLAFAIRWLHPERTLTEAEVQSIQDRMTAAVAEQCGGRLRER